MLGVKWATEPRYAGLVPRTLESMHREANQISEVPTVGLELCLGMVLEPPSGGQRCGLMALVPASESSEGPRQSVLNQKSGTQSFGPSVSLKSR